MVSGNEKCHDCRINWDGSSKGMESDIGVELINESKTSNFHVALERGFNKSVWRL